MNSRNQSYIIYALLFVAIVAMVYFNVRQQPNSQDVLTINQLAEDVKAGIVSRIGVESDDKLKVIYYGSSTDNLIERESRKEPQMTLVTQLLELGVTSAQLSPEKIKIDVQAPSSWMGIMTVLGYVLPFVMLAGIFWWIFRQAQGSNNAAMSFGKSKARMFSGDHPTVTFDDVAGAEESKEELKEVVEFLKEPQKFIQLGARIPKGVLLVGPPRNRQNPAGQGCFRRSGRAVLLDLRF